MTRAREDGTLLSRRKTQAVYAVHRQPDGSSALRDRAAFHCRLQRSVGSLSFTSIPARDNISVNSPDAQPNGGTLLKESELNLIVYFALCRSKGLQESGLDVHTQQSSLVRGPGLGSFAHTQTTAEICR